MKLATYKDDSRDGQLVVVSRDLSQAAFATASATRLQQVLDDWNFISPQLQDLYVSLNQGRARHAFNFDPRRCMAPLPRAHQRVTGWAYASHALRLNPAGDPAPSSGGRSSSPQMQQVHRIQQVHQIQQTGSDDLLGPHDDAWFGSATWGIDFEAGLAVITGDLDRGASATQGLDSVRLLMLAVDWRLRQLDSASELHSRPGAAFSAVAVTPDELGEGWKAGRLHATLQCVWNGKKVGQCETGPEMAFHFGQLIAHLAKTRRLRAGCIVGSGPVSNADASKGYACIAEKRALEITALGAAKTGFMQLGDRLRVALRSRDGQSVFGEIDQRVTGPGMTHEAEAAGEPGAARPADDQAAP